MGDASINLPPGFRFYPSDEEIVTSYLYERVKDPTFSAIAVGEADLNKYEPWELPKMATMGEKEWYFFCERDKKYPTGKRTNRATKTGYWKATGKDKEIVKGKGRLAGMKKTLVFYLGRAPKGEKTNWVMHEYRLEGKTSFWKLPTTAKDEWVVCRVFHKDTGLKKNSNDHDHVSGSSLPPLSETSPYVIPVSNDYSNFVPVISMDYSSNNNNYYNSMSMSNTTAMDSPNSSYGQQNYYSTQNLPSLPTNMGDYVPQPSDALIRRHCKVATQMPEIGHSDDRPVGFDGMAMAVDGQISNNRTALVDLESLLNKYS